MNSVLLFYAFLSTLLLSMYIYLQVVILVYNKEDERNYVIHISPVIYL